MDVGVGNCVLEVQRACVFLSECVLRITQRSVKHMKGDHVVRTDQHKNEETIKHKNTKQKHQNPPNKQSLYVRGETEEMRERGKKINRH
mmetsp:Transcript_15936/g.18316  ORF Transcript_15936/g.18316 Transcript_15936/m.18316 type:complete len:89 (+) Transcript_15936:146-412(+)